MKLHKKSRRHVSACCQDVSVYYAASDVTTSPSAKFILDVVDCKEKVWASVGLLSWLSLLDIVRVCVRLRKWIQAYARMPLLATPSETHGVSGFKITKMSKQECLNKELRVIRLGVVLLFSLTFLRVRRTKIA